MKMKTNDRAVQSLFKERFYTIPRFQRPYSWTREQLEEFWDDAIASDESDYFIGAIVVYEDASRSDCFDIVDGQQRLTTITLLLAAIRNSFGDNGLPDGAQGVQAVLERKDIDNKQRFTLESQTPYPFLQSAIQQYPSSDHDVELGEEERKLSFAFKYFESQVASVVEAVNANASLSPDKRPARIEEQLKHLRSKVLALLVIEITLSNDDDAYLIFETLNSRGMDLGVSDLVKNHVTKKIRPSNKGLDPAKDKYLQILERFDESEVRIDINAFLHHSWLSREEYVGQKKLFKAIKKKVKTRKEAESFLSEVVADSLIYRALLEPGSRKWRKEDSALVDSLDALQLFGVAQSRPLAVALLRAYLGKKVKLKFAKKAFRELESYHFIFTAVTGQRAGGGFAKMYASDARAIEAADTETAVRNVWDVITAKLRAKLPPAEEFTASFEQLRFLNDATKDKKLVRYILARLATAQTSEPLQSVHLWTIEHLIPQVEIDAAGSPSEHDVGQIGNLVLVPEALNESLGTQDFEGKIKIMKKYPGFKTPGDLAKFAVWTPAEVKIRTISLAGLAYSEVWRL